MRSKLKVNPLFVSPGHLADFETSTALALATGRGYRLPEPTRIADKLSKELKTPREGSQMAFELS